MAKTLADLPLAVLKMMLAVTERESGKDSDGAKALRRVIERKENPRPTGATR